mmetsp:Transcript_22915/g.22215  ORF Transcript_22915/g.22215 Transcript_22915/m.22215 type:complete len:92 (-) Transcript_22915:728-1003(-)
MWNERIYYFEREAVYLTYLMEVAWFYFFQHAWDGIFATKNKRVMHFASFDNFLDFMLFATGFSYAMIVYKKYMFDTFLQELTAYEQAAIYW